MPINQSLCRGPPGHTCRNSGLNEATGYKLFHAVRIRTFNGNAVCVLTSCPRQRIALRHQLYNTHNYMRKLKHRPTCRPFFLWGVLFLFFIWEAVWYRRLPLNIHETYANVTEEEPRCLGMSVIVVSSLVSDRVSFSAPM